LAAGELCVGDLQKRLGLPQPTVSHHLTILRGGHLVVSRRGGKRVLYALGERVRPAEGAIHIAAGGFSISVGRTAASSDAGGAIERGNDPASESRQGP
jgi:DNA-binding transcriptional ArsR family regulator